jgi:hypothetical protein
LFALAAVADTIYAQYGVMMVATIASPRTRARSRPSDASAIRQHGALDIVSVTLNEKGLGSASAKPSP